MTTDRDAALRRAELLVRQGQLDAAISQYSQLVDAHPNDWAMLNALGDLLVRAGASHRAVPLFSRIADAYLDEGFYAKAAGFYKKILKFSPQDEVTLLNLGRACAQQGLRADARRHLQTVMAARQRRGDSAGVAAVLCSLDELDAADFAGRIAAVRALAALQPRAALPRFRSIAAELDARSRHTEALALWQEIHALDPSDRTARLALGRAALDRNEPHQALGFLGVPTGWDQADEVELVVESQARAGLLEESRETLIARLRAQPGERGRLTALAVRVLGPDWDAGSLGVERAFETAAEFVEPAPASLGGLDQHDVASVDPDEQAWVEDQAFDRPGNVELMFDATIPIAVEPILDDEFDFAGDVPANPDTANVPPDPMSVGAAESALPADVLDPLAGEIEDEGLLAEIAVTAAPRAFRVIEVELDLTEHLNAVASEAGAVPAVASVSPEPALAADTGARSEPTDLDATFAAMRDQTPEPGSDLLSLGRTYRGAGLDQQAIETLIVAAHDQAQRYEAAIALVEMFGARHDPIAMIEWLERAADSAPSQAKRGAVLYRLGMLLEQSGERDRALAVMLELKALAPGFRDVSARVARLEAARSGGGSFNP